MYRVVRPPSGFDRGAGAPLGTAMALNTSEGIPSGNLELPRLAQGREEEALVCRERAMESHRKNPYFNAFLAQEALAASQWDEAEKRMKVALRILPHEPEFLLLLARICLGQGREKAAVKALELAKKWTIPADQPRWDAKLALLKGRPS